MNTGFINTGKQRLHYTCWGGGAKVLLAFHGYGNSAHLFHALGAQVASAYTTISVDLPHHGSSEWAGSDPWTKNELVAFVQGVMALTKVERITLTGFSLGGRVCLNIIEQLPAVVEKAVLIAPDGLAPNPLYWFVTRNPAGMRLFNGFVDKPDRYIRFVDWLHGRKWLNASKHKFVLQYVSAPAARAFLKKVWPGMRLLVPDRRKVQRLIGQYRIPTYIFMGRYDRIIPPRQALTFARGNPHIQVQVLDKGHRLMDGDGLRHIAAALTNA